MNDSARVPWSRAVPKVDGPTRNAGGFYRTAQKKGRKGEPASGGIPLNTANAAVVAAVRLAYEVAEAQIDRSTRLARRLRDAGDREAGPHSDRKALDATERIVQKAFLSGLEWWEGSVAEGRCPVKRLAAAEYQMIGTLLGFGTPGAQPAPPAAPAPPQDRATAAPRPAPGVLPLVVVHAGDKTLRRPVKVRAWELADAAPGTMDLWFHGADAAGGTPIPGTLEVAKRGAPPRLILRWETGAHGGLWKCAICTDEGEQVGFIELEL